MRQATPREAPAHRGTPRFSTFRPLRHGDAPSGPEPRTIFRPAGWTPAAPSKQPDRNAINCKSLRGRPLEPRSCPKGWQLTGSRVLADESGIARPSLRRNRRSGTGAPVRRVSRFGKPECKSSENSGTGSSNPVKTETGYPPGAAQRCALEKKALQGLARCVWGYAMQEDQTHAANPTRRAGGGVQEERGGRRARRQVAPDLDAILFALDEPEPGPVARRSPLRAQP